MMKITERHVMMFSIAMFVIATGLFIYLPFIGIEMQLTKEQSTGTTFMSTADIEKLCKIDVGVRENK
ncbi:MAG: hypothetical protein ACYSR0_11510 [Planctomycetota bacterium]|jgi:hypothetical protein